MRIALHNIHLLPDLKFHGYVLELLRRRLVTVLYFSDRRGVSLARTVYRLVRQRHPTLQVISWSEFDFVFSARELSRRADVLLDLNLMCTKDLESEVPSTLSRFDGLKIFHIGDYFWYHPGSEKYRRLRSVGVDHLFGYAMHDRYCGYFDSHFPGFRGKVWGIPFGFAPRFQSKAPFLRRINKAVALGSVNPLRPLGQPVHNFRETADYFPDENWFHKFRRQLVLNKSRLTGVMDSMLPEFPAIKDFKYDLVAKLNEYRMFVTGESIYLFPSAKVFEGLACGTVLFGADHDCNKEYGLEDGRNCVMFRQYDIDSFRDKVAWYQEGELRLAAIATEGYHFVRQYYSHKGVADRVVETTALIWGRGGDVIASPLADRLPTPLNEATDRGALEKSKPEVVK